MRVPAICESCSTIYSVVLPLGAAAPVEDMPGGQCPRCSGTGMVPGRTYGAFARIVDGLLATPAAHAEWSRLIEILDGLRVRNISPAETAARIPRYVPAFRGVADEFRHAPENSQQILGTLLLGVVRFLRDDPRRLDGRTIVEQSLEQLSRDLPPANQPLPARRLVRAPGRNDACPCGSGKRFKHCHGVLQ
jgi:hypothetical protein